ncbi:MAG TPA: response regulator transcription factor [Longimicrobiales bacterium]
MIRVIAIEDDARYRASLEVLFRHSEDFALVRTFEAADIALDELDAALRRGEEPGWDLVLMDLDLPGLGGIECTRRIKERLPRTTIVVLTVFEERASVLNAICAGADGYLLKHTPADQLLTQLRAVIAGGSPLSAGIARTVLDLVRHLDGGGRAREAAARLDLSARELDVLRCLVRGMPYKRVAHELDISIHTVRNHIRSIYSKLQVHSVAAAVSRAFREGLV